LRNPWLPAIGWMALIFWFSSQPDLPKAPDALTDLLLKKGLHAFEYGVLALLFWRALRSQISSRHAVTMAWVLSALYAASDEFHQTFVPGRAGRLLDVVVDWLGAGLALLLAMRLAGERRGAGQGGKGAEEQGSQGAEVLS